jgi:phosphohistidine phosphatase
MKKLLLLRHAHAEQPEPGMADIDRPLSERGRVEALQAAECIAEAGLRCDALLVSPALRTRQTAIIVAAALDLTEEPRIEQSIYLGDPAALLATLRRCPADLTTLMMVGHNPVLSALAQRFKGAPSGLDLRPSGLCAITFAAETAWSALRPRLATDFELLR